MILLWNLTEEKWKKIMNVCQSSWCAEERVYQLQSKQELYVDTTQTAINHGSGWVVLSGRTPSLPVRTATTTLHGEWFLSAGSKLMDSQRRGKTKRSAGVMRTVMAPCHSRSLEDVESERLLHGQSECDLWSSWLGMLIVLNNFSN